MLREIKFRGKSAGEWHYGHFFAYRNTGGGTGAHFIVLQEKEDKNLKPIQVMPETVGQFTGLHDINGNDIYEGDIVQIMYRIEEGRGKNKHEVLRPYMNSKPNVISFRMGAFGYVNFKETEYVEEEWLPFLDVECEILGNIFDNPEIEHE